MHAEPMLLVDDDQRERCELHAFLEEGMGADHDGRMPFADSGQRGAARLAGLPAGEQRDGDPQGFEPALEIQRVLVGE